MSVLKAVPLQGLRVRIDHDRLLSALVRQAGQALIQLFGEKRHNRMEEFDRRDKTGVEEEQRGQEFRMFG
jgi:hypothetical protein